ncbi:MAG TPA: RNB domain-containing ribonuclease, partial [Mycobacterium sp.]|nr:RNB domain-containing ribonuclease [Mycobacterium sp.]
MFARDELLRLIRETVHHPATSRELAQLLRVPSEERTAFKRQIRELAASGDLLHIRGNRYGLPQEMNLVVGRLSTNPAGFGFVVPEGPSTPLGAGAKRGDVYIAASNLTEAMHGDRVVARVERETPKGLEGRIIRILERSQATLVGRYETDEAGLGYVVPFDRRVLTDVHVPTGQSSSAEPGEMVLVEITRWPTATRGPVGRVVEVLGNVDEPGVDTQIIIRKFNIPDTHSEDAIEEAKRLGGAVRERDIRGRTDFRPVVTVTIDGEHARDFDDAITIERLTNGNFWLGVHIADVSHYVKDGSALDEEA